MWRIVGLALLFSGLLGCSQTPVAPSLENVAVYQDQAAGVRFLAPDGWVLYARSTTPPGKVNKPIRLVAYQRTTSDGRADLELYICDYPTSKSLLEYLKEHPIGPEKWKEPQPATPVKLGEYDALKHLFVSQHQSERQRDFWEIRREGDRVFLFVCSAMTADRSTRDQARRAVETVTFQLN